MKLLSTVNLDGFNYFVILNDSVSSQSWYLFSEIHPDDYGKTGADLYAHKLNVYDLALPVSRSHSDEYLIEAYEKSKRNGKIRIINNTRLLNRVIKCYVDCRDFNYPKSGILVNEESYEPNRVKKFSAFSSNVSIEYTQVDNLFTHLKCSNTSMSIDFNEFEKAKIPRKGLEWTKLAYEGENFIRAGLNQPSIDTLKETLDLSWYINSDTGEYIKDYTSIKTIDELETKFITPFIRELSRQISRGEKPLVGCDTETTGLKVLNISKENPMRDEISTIQFSWKDNQGVIIYLDMEYFSNVPKEYFFKRMGHLFKYYTEKQRGSDCYVELIKDEEGNDIHEKVNIPYGSFDLVGHNTMFDSRVTLSEGYQFYFTQDTLQMAFNLDPTACKKNKGLKALTRRLLGWETPELTEILGKGNEGCFRYLKDEEITRIYGCADTDTTRTLWFVLKDLTEKASDKMFNSYQKLDPITWYVGARTEYNGLRLNQELLSKNTANIKKDLKTIQDLIYTYVGSIINSRVSHAFNGDSEVELDESYRYEFKLSGKQVRHVVYDLLKYPVLVTSKKTGEPCVNSDAIKKLLYKKLKRPSHVMKKDVLRADATSDKDVLISADEFNSYKFPLCYLLREYATLNKEYTAYYKPFEMEDTEGKLFKGISTTNIETRRISCPAQTIKKSLKKGVISYDDDSYCANFDLNQVEARVFTSESGDIEGIKYLNNDEKDYHTENASRMYGIPAYTVDKATRKKSKTLGFGIPYGLMDRKMCERIFTVVNDVNLIETRRIRALFEKANYKEMEYLNGIRARALDPVEVPVELKRFWGMNDDAKVGLVKNANGFWRYFRLDNVLGNKRNEASVQRQAGNYPIQSFAADLYRLLIKRLWDNIVDEGLEDKIKFDMYIHDEIEMSVHKSVDPRRLCDLIYRSCVVRLKGHTTYFVGLNFGDNWYDCKNDANEIPARLLKRISIAYRNGEYEERPWTDNPKEVIAPMIDQFKVDRSFELLSKIYSNLDEDVINVKELIDNFSNYTVRSYIDECPKIVKDPKNSKGDNASFLNGLCYIMQSKGKENVKIKVDDNIYTVKDYINLAGISKKEEIEEDIIDIDDFDNDSFIEEEDDFWSFDSNDSFFDSRYDPETGVYFYYDDDDDVKSELEVFKNKYKYCKPIGQKYVISLNNYKDINKVLKELEPYKSDKIRGKKVLFDTPIMPKVSVDYYEIDLDKMDNFVITLNKRREEILNGSR